MLYVMRYLVDEDELAVRHYLLADASDVDILDDSEFTRRVSGSQHPEQ